MKRSLSFFIFLLIFFSPGQSQTQTEPVLSEPAVPPQSAAQLENETPPSPPVFSSVEDELASLAALNDSIAWREQQREDIYRKMQAAVDPVEREKLLPELQEINAEINSLKQNFQSIAVKTDTSVFEKEPEKEFNWQTELGQLLEPLMKEMKAATKDSREMGELQDQLELNQTRKKTSEQALAGLAPLLKAEKDPELDSRLEDLQRIWSDRLRDADNKITAVEYQINIREKEKASPIEQAKGMATGFVRTRGLNLLLGVLAFVGVFLLMRGLQNSWSKFRPSRKKGRSFSSRLSSLIWTLLTLLFAIGAMIATFNATGDWFLLSLTLLFLMGIGWAGMKALPGMVELFRMMLNMGAVREDERLIYEGLPWKVNSISFRTELLNPLLNGGVLTLPTHMLVGLLSRPPGEDEEWFPSRKDDWVLLSDGTLGKVSYQTPSAVQIVSPGGSQKVYNTLQYMELSPTVLSTGFRRETLFGIDYRHLSEVVAGIPSIMHGHLKQALGTKLGENLQDLQVQLAEASDSSLKVSVVVDCKGGAAPDWPFVPMWVQAALVDLCHQKGWSIPFPQLQVHTDG